MKNYKIAIANDINIFDIKSLSNYDFASKHIAVNLYYLINELSKYYEIEWGDNAINNIENNIWNPEDVLIIQEMDSRFGRKLLSLGATPLLCTTFEGPFIGHWFYNKINYFGNIFKHIIVFDHKYPNINFNKNKIVDLGFPCVEKKNISKIFKPFDKLEWTNKKTIVGIWSNKHPSLHFRKIIMHCKNLNFKYLILEIISKIISRTYKNNKKHSLQDKRNETFLSLINYCDFDLYGKQWGNTYETPKIIYDKMMIHKKNIFEGTSKFLKKSELLRKYKFSLCFENSISRSYLSEKLFDCFINRVIPVYLGAFNISELIPKECFIDYRDFKSDKDLAVYLKSIDVNKANQYLKAAHNFLNSNQVLRYDCEFYTKTIVNLINKQ